MGTISDKLMRIINTKEDIRQALISKGYDVPTSIPFKEYAKMISDLPCRVDSFPDIEGIVARYSALGLTNEQMAANPVWVDKTGNGHDIQLKNFSWKGMSGVGGYETYHSVYNFTPDKYYVEAISKGKQHVQFTFKVTGLVDGNTLSLADTSSPSNVYGRWTKDGIYNVDIEIINTERTIYFYNGVSATRGEFTIEILPLYPGALVFDGVDDWAGCDNLPLLPKEKGYSIIALRNWITRYDATQYKRPLISNLDTNDEGAFLIEYRKDENVNDVTGFYNSFTDVYIDDNNPITWQTSSSYNGQIIKKGTSKSTNKLCICKTYFGQLGNYANAAIWELVILDHDATEEELTKIKDYFIKTYPWLFPYQAWTVTGKTNEDEDRATIANITGNGNDLVLSNFGFAEGSGYGLYAENYAGGRWVQSTDRADLTWTSYSVNITSVKVASTQLYYQSYPEQPSFTVPSYKIKVYGLKDGQTLSYKQVTSEGQQIYKISEDGIYTLPSFLFKANGDWYGFTLDKIQETCDITIEQIPEYEGYLITDGVDDKIVSAESIAFTDTWTIITDTVFLGKVSVACGILASNIFTVYNYQGSGMIAVTMGEGGSSLRVITSSIKAFSSDGTIYDAEWNEYHVEIGTIRALERLLKIGTSSNETSYFCQLAFKFLGIYNNQILSKDDCIKAYNYLQTLKAK